MGALSILDLYPLVRRVWKGLPNSKVVWKGSRRGTSHDIKVILYRLLERRRYGKRYVVWISNGIARFHPDNMGELTRPGGGALIVSSVFVMGSQLDTIGHNLE